MKNAFTLITIFALLFGLTLGCKNGVLSESKKSKSKCAKNLPALNSSKEYAARGMKASNEGDYECSLDDCEQALELNAKNGEALVCRGYARMKREEYDAAQSDFDQAINLSPNDPLALNQRSQLYRHTKQFAKALTDMNKVIELLPAHYYYEQRAKIYTDLNDYENALKDYTEAIRQKPENGYYYGERAALYRQMNKTDLAPADEKLRTNRQTTRTRKIPRQSTTKPSACRNPFIRPSREPSKRAAASKSKSKSTQKET